MQAPGIIGDSPCHKLFFRFFDQTVDRSTAGGYDGCMAGKKAPTVGAGWQGMGMMQSIADVQQIARDDLRGLQIAQVGRGIAEGWPGAGWMDSAAEGRWEAQGREWTVVDRPQDAVGAGWQGVVE